MVGKRLRVASRVLAALVLACALTALGAVAADRYQLPFLHGWALAHGSILVVFPIWFVIAFAALGPLVRVLARRFPT
jgi:hypothetical protein